MRKLVNKYFSDLYSFREDTKKPTDPLDPNWSEMVELINKVFGSSRLVFGVAKHGKAVINFNNAGYIGKLEKVLGFDALNSVIEKDLLLQWTQENIELIKNVPIKQIDMLQDVFYTAVSEGTSAKDVEKALKKVFDWSDGRARLIARDQVGKLNGKIDQIKQEQIGISEYIWVTVGDQSVRPRHQDRDGQRFSWNNPPLGGHPGQDIQCRCYAEPVLDRILGEGTLEGLGINTKFEKTGWLKREEKKYVKKYAR